MSEIVETGAPYLNLGRLTKRDIGQEIGDKGILLSTEFQHTNPITGNKTGGYFNYFAAPKDLQFLGGAVPRNIMKFGGTLVTVSLIRNLRGHDGMLAPSDSHLCASAKIAPWFLSDWHIPTADLVQEMAGAKRRHNLIGTFAEVGDPSRSTRYWTLSGSLDHLNLRAVVDVETGAQSFVHEDTLKFSCRPVRAEICPR